MSDDVETQTSEKQRSARAPRGTGRQIALTLLVATMVVLGAALLGNLGGDTSGASDAPNPVIPTATTLPPEGTLGLRFDQVQSLWNEVSNPPRISQGLRRRPETGEFDSFFHRFDSAANLSGAYRDSDDHLVALKVEVGVGHPEVHTMHVHLCHLVSPFSPECLEVFETTGLAGETFEELRDSGVSTSWSFGGNEWRLTEVGGVIAIRVLAPTAG